MRLGVSNQTMALITREQDKMDNRDAQAGPGRDPRQSPARRDDSADSDQIEARAKLIRAIREKARFNSLGGPGNPSGRLGCAI